MVICIFSQYNQSERRINAMRAFAFLSWSHENRLPKMRPATADQLHRERAPMFRAKLVFPIAVAILASIVLSVIGSLHNRSSPRWLNAAIAEESKSPSSARAGAADSRSSSDLVFQASVLPILKTYCVRCHGLEKKEGNIDFAAISGVQAARQARRLWRKTITQLEVDAMPPQEAKQLTKSERVELLRWMQNTVERNDPRDRDPGPALVRRLSRPEYNATIRDVIGIEFDAGDAVGIPDESLGHGFANQANVLTLSPTLIEKYFAAADEILDRITGPETTANPDAIPVATVKPAPLKSPRESASDGNSSATLGTKGTLSAQYKCAGSNSENNQLRAHFRIANTGKETVPLSELNLRYWFTADGTTEFQLWCDYAKVDAKNVTLIAKKLDKPVRDADAYVDVGFREGMLAAGADTGEVQLRVAAHDWMQFDQTNDFSFAASQTDFADAPRVSLYRNGKLVFGIEPSGAPSPAKTSNPRGASSGKDAKPAIKVNPELQKSRDTIFFAKPGSGVSEKEAARRIVTAFARRAWRRPVSEAEMEGLIAIYDRATSKGADFLHAVRPMLKAILVSPHFLFRIEKDLPAEGENTYRRVNDHELAVRLSYFIWSSVPDDELASLADQGKLGNPAELERQTRRMLADPKAEALTNHFGVPWLRLGNLATARPTMEYFPSFTPSLKEAMFQETKIFFNKLREEDRNVLELIDADYSYLNEELANHYGILGVQGKEMRKVALRPGDHRGGLLGMGSILSLTSHTFRTSPTLRGKYVLEVLLGAPPPPPPANAGVIKDETKDKEPKTFRESLMRHASDAACAACHRKIDPLGFGLENYDGVGRWREESGGKIDTTGGLPAGEKFTGPVELKKILLKRQDQFLLNLSEQMLCYALGRPLEDCDEGAALNIQAAMQIEDQRFSTLVVSVVKSFPFQHRRNTP